MHKFNSHSPTLKGLDQTQKFLTGELLVVDLNRYLTNTVSTLWFPVPANNTPQNISCCRILLAAIRPFQLCGSPSLISIGPSVATPCRSDSMYVLNLFNICLPVKESNSQRDRQSIPSLRLSRWPSITRSGLSSTSKSSSLRAFLYVTMCSDAFMYPTAPVAVALNAYQLTQTAQKLSYSQLPLAVPALSLLENPQEVHALLA